MPETPNPRIRRETLRGVFDLHITFKNPESELVPLSREQVGEQVKEQAIQAIKDRPSPYVLKLLKNIDGEMTVLEMMAKLKLGGRRNFLEKYLSPAIVAAVVFL